MSDEKTWRDYLVCERCGLFREDECECSGRERALLLDLERAAREMDGACYNAIIGARKGLRDALAALDEFRKGRK